VNFPLYRPDQERGACGIGFAADTSGKPSFGALGAAAACPDSGSLIIGSEAT